MCMYKYVYLLVHCSALNDLCMCFSIKKKCMQLSVFMYMYVSVE